MRGLKCVCAFFVCKDDGSATCANGGSASEQLSISFLGLVTSQDQDLRATLYYESSSASYQNLETDMLRTFSLRRFAPGALSIPSPYALSVAVNRWSDFL